MKATEWIFGMSSCAAGYSRATFEDYLKHGVQGIEISTGNLEAANVNWKEVKKNSDETGVKIWSTHLPFWPFDILDFSDFDKAKREKALDIQCELVKKASEAGLVISSLAL